MVDTTGFIPASFQQGVIRAPLYKNSKELDLSPPVLDGTAVSLFFEGQARDSPWYFRASKLNPEDNEARLYRLDRDLRAVQRQSLEVVRATLKKHLPSLATGEYLNGDTQSGSMQCRLDHGLVEYAKSKCLDGLVWYTSVYRDITPLYDNTDNGQGNLEQELERALPVSEVLAEGFGTSMGYLQDCALTVDERQSIQDVMYSARTLYNLVLRREMREFDRLILWDPQRQIPHNQPHYGILRILLETEGHRLSRPSRPSLRMQRAVKLMLDGRARVTEAELELALPPGARGNLVFPAHFDEVALHLAKQNDYSTIQYCVRRGYQISEALARHLARWSRETLRYCMEQGYQASPDVFKLLATDTRIDWDLLRTIVFQRGHRDDLGFEPEAKDQHGVDVNVLRGDQFRRLEHLAQGDERKLEVVKRIQLLNSQWGHAMWTYDPLNHTTDPMEVDTDDD